MWKKSNNNNQKEMKYTKRKMKRRNVRGARIAMNSRYQNKNDLIRWFIIDFLCFAFIIWSTERNDITPWPRHFLLHHEPNKVFKIFMNGSQCMFFPFRFFFRLHYSEREKWSACILCRPSCLFESETFWPAPKIYDSMWIFTKRSTHWIWIVHEKGLIVFFCFVTTEQWLKCN